MESTGLLHGGHGEHGGGEVARVDREDALAPRRGRESCGPPSGGGADLLVL